MTESSTALTESHQALAQRRFGTALTTLDQTNREVLYTLLEQGFNPYTDLIIYENRPYVSIDGWYNAIQRAGRRIGRMPTRPVNQTERLDYGLRDDEVGAVCTVYLAGDSEPFTVGFGKSSAERPYRKNQVETQHPYRMAEKRAEAQALRKTLRAVGMSVEVGTVDEGGNVIEGSAHEIEGDPAGAEPSQRRTVPTEPPDFIEYGSGEPPKRSPMVEAAVDMGATADEDGLPRTDEQAAQITDLLRKHRLTQRWLTEAGYKLPLTQAQAEAAIQTLSAPGFGMAGLV